MVEKEGLQATIDFMKLLLGLAVGAIAFLIQPASFAGSRLLKSLAIVSLICLATTTITALMAISRAGVMLSQGEYSVEDAQFTLFGRVCLLSFGLGFLILSVEVAIKVLRT